MQKYSLNIVRLRADICLMGILCILSLNCIMPPHAYLASSFIQTATGTKKSSEATPTSVSATFTTGATAGRLIIAVLGVGSGAAATLTAPSGFSTAINQSSTTSSPGQGIFYKIAAGGETTITATVSSNPSAIGLHIYEYSGSETTLDQTSSNTGSSGTPNSGTITTTTTNALILASFTDNTNTNFNDTSWNDTGEGFTERNDFKTTGLGTSANFAGGDNLTNSAGSHSVTTSIGSTANWRGQIVSFKSSAVAPSVDIVDGSGVSVASPSVTFSSQSFSFSATVRAGTLGVASQKIRISSGTASSWTLSIAATSGPTTLWNAGGGKTYDFNDTGATDTGVDTDTKGGRLTVNPSASTITPLGTCTNTGLTKGSSTAFLEGTTNSVTVTSASGAGTPCQWDVTGVSLSQDIPASQATGTYTLGMTLTMA